MAIYCGNQVCSPHGGREASEICALADVSKEKLDIYNPVTKATTSEPDTPEGLRKAVRKAKAVVCSEPTGDPT